MTFRTLTAILCMCFLLLTAGIGLLVSLVLHKLFIGGVYGPFIPFVIFTAMIGPVFLSKPLQPLKVGTWLLYFILSAVITYWPDPRRNFLSDLERIQEGMNETEVEQIMDGYIKGTGWEWPMLAQSSSCQQESGKKCSVRRDNPPELEFEGTKVYRHSHKPDYSSDWGVVYFKDGKVTGVEFAPD